MRHAGVAPHLRAARRHGPGAFCHTAWHRRHPVSCSDPAIRNRTKIMHHPIGFIQDMAVVMLIAGIVSVVFHRFRQPVVLGYIVAGLIIGPHTPPNVLLLDEATIKTLGEIGVIFLMFSLGLEFSLRKLVKVGATAFVAALSEIVLMIWIGYEVGRWFGWRTMDALFLGAMLAISSTTIIVKALAELGLKRERFAQLVFGILIVEDILAIAMIALLSGIADSGSLQPFEVVTTLGRLLLFITVSLVVGILVVPRFLHYVARFKSNEVLLITVLGLCFGFCFIVVKLDYSIALGAFLIGAIIAESRELHLIERLIAPLRDMFSAVFFVSIGLLLDPHVLIAYWLPISVITVAVVLGKILTCGLGTFLAGHDGRTAMRVGMSVAQIGEFSFIIASLGLTLKVTSDFLYPIVVAVSALTTLLTPYLIKLADPLTRRLSTSMPASVSSLFATYGQWLSNLQPSGDGATVFGLVRRIVVQIGVNLALVSAVFLAVSYGATILPAEFDRWVPDVRLQNVLLWGASLLVSLPLLIAVYRKLKSLAMLLAEIGVRPAVTGRFTQGLRRAVAELVPMLGMLGVFLLVAALSGSILPPADLLIAVVTGAVLLAALMWRWFVQLHARLQIALRETLDQSADG
jgi:CPA2 family monovalent cation:H+ antiporter-2